MTKIEFQYFEGCPSYKEALDHLKEIINEESIEADLELIRVDSPEDAQKAGFQGSPSIKANGVDLEDKNAGFSYNCRLYDVNGNLTGSPPKEFIRKKLLRKLNILTSS